MVILSFLEYLFKHYNVSATFPELNQVSGPRGFPMELTPRGKPCCIVRIFEECIASVRDYLFYNDWSLNKEGGMVQPDRGSNQFFSHE